MFGNDEVAVVGDPTNVGGRILEGAATFDIDGAPVAVQGSAVMCGLCGPTKIARGSSRIYVMGVPIALHGDPLLCGHTISVRRRQRMTSVKSSGGSACPPSINRYESDAASGNETRLEMASGFDQRLEIRYPDGKPYAGAAFVKAIQGMSPLKGKLSSEGTSPPIRSTRSGPVRYCISAPKAEAN